jgi:hypothetical protein
MKIEIKNLSNKGIMSYDIVLPTDTIIVTTPPLQADKNNLLFVSTALPYKSVNASLSDPSIP